MSDVRTRRTRIEGLDALRGVAVGLVMLRHAWPSTFGGAGIVGVTIFFALSGYLITEVLARDLERFGVIRWKRFYLHRAFRLFPALVLLLAVFTLVHLVWNPTGERASVLPSLLVAISYTADLPLPVQLNGDLGHLWSLAVEEQFYVVWPVTLFLLARAKRSLRAAALVVAGLFTLSCWGTLWALPHPADLYTLPTTWVSAMALGGAAYLWRPFFDRIPKSVRAGGAVAGAAVLVGLSIAKEAKDSPLTYLIWPSLIAVATVSIIIYVSEWKTLPARVLRPAVWLGTISYGAYLWNLPIRVWLHAWMPDAPSLLMGLSIPLTIAAAVISWFTVEWVGRQLRERFDDTTTSKQLDPVSASSG